MEEPVSSDDVTGLRAIRDQGPPGVHIAAGEYGWDLFDFRALLEGGAVDVLQADVGRCGGYTPFLRVGALCEAHCVPLSSHTSPALHTPAMCAVHRGIHTEYFHDHVRIEALLFEGAPRPEDGILSPPRDGPGMA